MLHAASCDRRALGLERVAQDNDHVLKGRSRTERNRLFRAIERGDFGDLDDFDDDEEDDEDVGKPVKGGYAGKKKWNADEPFADDLQLQWEKDRATKAANKRKRAAERAAAAADPYRNTHKKAARAARRAERAGVKVDVAEELEDSDEPMSFATNLHELDAQIQRFLRDAAHTTLSLPPMDKRARAQVHMLASAYSLKSQSRGSGAKRFPVLMKNSRSGLNVDKRRVRVILGGGDAGFGSGAKWAPKKGKKSAGGGGGGGGAGIAVPRNQEGAEVGFGAEKIGEDNIGHKLLTMMGWKEGSGVGASPGISSAIGASIKVTKGGLGF